MRNGAFWVRELARAQDELLTREHCQRVEVPELFLWRRRGAEPVDVLVEQVGVAMVRGDRDARGHDVGVRGVAVSVLRRPRNDLVIIGDGAERVEQRAA